MCPPDTANDPFDPETTPEVTVPSPQSIAAVNPLATSSGLPSVKFATEVPEPSATCSVAAFNTAWPDNALGLTVAVPVAVAVAVPGASSASTTVTVSVPGAA